MTEKQKNKKVKPENIAENLELGLRHCILELFRIRTVVESMFGASVEHKLGEDEKLKALALDLNRILQNHEDQVEKLKEVGLVRVLALC